MKAANEEQTDIPATSPKRQRSLSAGPQSGLGSGLHTGLRRLPLRVNNEIDPVADDTVDIAGRMVAMIPAELLQPTEIIVLLLKPSAWFILLSCIGSLVTILIVTGIALALIDNNVAIGLGRKDVVLLAVGLLGARLFWQFLEWLSRVYVLTDQRVIRVRGVIRVSIFEAPIKQIQHTNTYFSLRERFFSLGTIAFATAGTGIVEAYWEMLAQPLEVHRIVVQTLNRYR